MSRRVAVTVAALVVLALGAGPFIGAVTAAAAPEQTAEGVFIYVSANRVMEYDAVTGASSPLEYIEEGAPIMPARALGGAAVCWSVDPPSGSLQTYVSETFTNPGQETLHTLNIDLFTFPRLSPDGTKLLYIAEEPDPFGGFTNNLHVQQVTDGTELFSIPDVDAADWSPDGGEIVFASYPRARFDPDLITLYVYDVATAEETKVPAGRLAAIGEVNTYSPRWSPSGEWIAFLRYGEDTIDIVLTDPSGSTEEVLSTVSLGRFGMGMEWARMPNGTERLFVESVEAGGAPYVIVEMPGPDGSAAGERILHGAFFGQAQPEFTDIMPEHPFYRQIRDLASLRVIGGFDDGSFGSTALVKRAQYAKMITVALGEHDSEWTNWTDPTFPDVPRPASQNDDLRYPFDYVEEAASAGLVRGTAAGSFNPWAEISRVQLALMIARAGGERLEEATPADYVVFTDVAGLSQEALDAVAVVYHNGIINGKTATTFAPHDPATRGQAAAMTWRLMERLELVGL